MREIILYLAQQLKAQKYPAGKTTGECLNAAVELADLLADKGLNASPVSGTFNGADHCWVSINLAGEEWYLDITADQFGYPGVIFCPLEEIEADIQFLSFENLP